MYKSANYDGLNFLDISTPHNISLASQNFYPTGEVHPNRIFNYHDLVYIIEGEWEIIQNNKTYKLLPGDAIFLFANNHHYSIKKCSNNTKTYFIHFVPNENDRFENVDTKENYLVFPVKIHCGNNPLIIEYFNKIISLYWSSLQIKQPLLNAYTTLLLSSLFEQSFKTENSNMNLINQIISFLNNNLSKFYSIDELSNMFSISRRKLIYLFKQFTNHSPHKYQIEMKLSLCNNTIRDNPKVLIKELVEKFGFYDEFQLSKLYKDKYGFSPKSKEKNIDYNKKYFKI